MTCATGFVLLAAFASAELSGPPCTGSGDPKVGSCYAGEYSLFSMVEKFNFTIDEITANDTGNVDIWGSGAAGTYHCANWPFEKVGQKVNFERSARRGSNPAPCNPLPPANPWCRWMCSQIPPTASPC